MKKKILVIGCLPESLMNFRGDLIKAFRERGLDVVAMSAAAPDGVRTWLESEGVEFCSYDVQRNGLSPLKDLKTLVQLYRACLHFKPSVVFAYTIKPIIWGGIAARLTRRPFYALVTGLGFAFQGQSVARRLLKKAVVALYKLALSKSESVIFQNSDNMKEFIDNGIVDSERCYVVNGSGVDTKKFSLEKLPEFESPDGLRFLCVARLLGEKGLREYARAADIVKTRYPDCDFLLVGPEDPSPDGIPLSLVNSWESVDYYGEVTSIAKFYKDCHVFVLPSYHEGLPRSTLEAMSTGRPVITTNATGCRETVVDGENGFQVEVKNSHMLAEKMIWCVNHQETLALMGMKSRYMVESKFDVHKVNLDILRIMKAVT